MFASKSREERFKEREKERINQIKKDQTQHSQEIQERIAENKKEKQLQLELQKQKVFFRAY